jgi:hypothetical protein
MEKKVMKRQRRSKKKRIDEKVLFVATDGVWI